MQESGIRTGYPSGSQSQSKKGGGILPPKKEEAALTGLPEHVRAWFTNLQKFDILFCSLKSKIVVYQFVKYTVCLKCNAKIACFLRNKQDLDSRRQIRDVLMNDLYGIANDLVCLTQAHGKEVYDCIQFRLNDLEAVIECEREPKGDREVLLDAQSTKNRLTTVMYSLVSQLQGLSKEGT